MKLDRKFFERDTLVVAKDLLGKYLIRNLDGNVFAGMIVETEAYIGEDDLACHASKGRTSRTEIMYGEAGHAYVYMIYGMYHLINIVTEKIGFPAAVLIRAVEPILLGHSEQSEESRSVLNRPAGAFSSQAPQNDRVRINELKKIANGPGKLCRWMGIDRSLKGTDVTKSEELFIIEELPKSVILNSIQNLKISNQVWDDKYEKFEIIESKRIGIDYAKHCIDHPWRFYIKRNEFVSKR